MLWRKEKSVILWAIEPQTLQNSMDTVLYYPNFIIIIIIYL